MVKQVDEELIYVYMCVCDRIEEVNTSWSKRTGWILILVQPLCVWKIIKEFETIASQVLLFFFSF